MFQVLYVHFIHRAIPVSFVITLITLDGSGFFLRALTINYMQTWSKIKILGNRFITFFPLHIFLFTLEHKILKKVSNNYNINVKHFHF